MIKLLSILNQFLIEEFKCKKFCAIFATLKKISTIVLSTEVKKRKENEKKKKENGKTNMAVDCQKQHEKIVVETFSF